MIVKVTKRDITQGVLGDTQDCPVARGIRRLVKRGTQVEVIGDEGVEFETKDKIVVRKLPNKALDFICGFDGGFTVEPFEFNLNIPKELRKA